jgi:hypothetical protein
MLMALGAALALLAPSAAAGLEAATPNAGAQNSVGRVVEIRVSGDTAALLRVRMTARELLLRLDVQANVKAIDEPETSSTEPTPLVVAYVDLRSTASPSIDIEDGRTHQVLTQRRLMDVTSLETGCTCCTWRWSRRCRSASNDQRRLRPPRSRRRPHQRSIRPPRRISGSMSGRSCG